MHSRQHRSLMCLSLIPSAQWSLQQVTVQACRYDAPALVRPPHVLPAPSTALQAPVAGYRLSASPPAPTERKYYHQNLISVLTLAGPVDFHTKLTLPQSSSFNISSATARASSHICSFSRSFPQAPYPPDAPSACDTSRPVSRRPRAPRSKTLLSARLHATLSLTTP